MLSVARTSCLICGSRQLQPFLNLSETGIPHDAAGHNFTHAYHVIAICEACGHGQLEIYSHDCFHYYGDEDWDMYWWYALQPAEVLRLRALLEGCPDRLNAQCSGALHRSLRESSERLWGGIKHAINPEGKISFAWLSFIEQPDRPSLQVDRQQSIGQAD